MSKILHFCITVHGLSYKFVWTGLPITNLRQSMSFHDFNCTFIKNELIIKKLKDLNNFEATNEDRFDEEFKIYKQKLDHIYDLCRLCKQKLNQHLTRQDNQIGQFINGQMTRTANQLTPLKSAMQAKQTRNMSTDVDNPEFQLKRRVTMSKPPVVADVDMAPRDVYLLSICS
jgi:hypothetical protein